jgi:hypothetical protein
MRKIILPSMLGILLVGNSFASAWVETKRVTTPNNTAACTCQVKTFNNEFTSQVIGTAKVTLRTYTDYPDDLETYTDEIQSEVSYLSAESSHATYKEALQSCNMTIKALVSSGSCTAGSVMPAVGDLVTDEVGERTRFFNLSAHEQAQLQFALSMARIESNEELYRRIAEIYENKSYEDREFLLDLLSQIRPIKIKKTKIIKHRH